MMSSRPEVSDPVTLSTTPEPTLTIKRETHDSAPERYVAEVAASIRKPSATAIGKPLNDSTTVDALFSVLTSRQFSHLSRRQAEVYRPRMCASVTASVSRGQCIPFWYDIGPGYHASLHPGVLATTCNVGLGELLLLAQVSAFLSTVSAYHAPGGRFRLVVDNLCALRTNDIPLERTTQYCSQLRILISELGLQDQVELLVESEAFDLNVYDRLLRSQNVPDSDLKNRDLDIANVERFLGRKCGPAEAIERTMLYQKASAVTETLLSGVVTGVRLTQRATQTTLGFRSFPGGDSRIQCGEVALTRNLNRRILPILITSRNFHLYDCIRVASSSQSPPSLTHFTFAEQRHEQTNDSQDA